MRIKDEYTKEEMQKVVDEMLVNQMLEIMHNIETLTPKQAKAIFEVLKENDDE